MRYPKSCQGMTFVEVLISMTLLSALTLVFISALIYLLNVEAELHQMAGQWEQIHNGRLSKKLSCRLYSPYPVAALPPETVHWVAWGDVYLPVYCMKDPH